MITLILIPQKNKKMKYDKKQTIKKPTTVGFFMIFAFYYLRCYYLFAHLKSLLTILDSQNTLIAEQRVSFSIKQQLVERVYQPIQHKPSVQHHQHGNQLLIHANNHHYVLYSVGQAH